MSMRHDAGRRIGAALLTVLLAAGLGACQAVPGEGPVQVGLERLDQGEQPVEFNPGRPIEGADQEAIVRGFIRAATSSANDYEIAREFLTPEFAEQWLPDEQVFVDEGTQTYHSVGENAGELSLSGLATVDQAGTLTPLPPGPAETVMSFHFAQIGGEWRISYAPNGVILDKLSFPVVWTYRSLYFLTPDDRLVAETRWYLNRETLRTQIVGGLLGGPNDADAESLRTAFPAGTTLASETVPVNDGIARLEFSEELLHGEADNLELVHEQVAASLQSVQGITGFEIAVNGGVVDAGTVTSPDTINRSSENLVTTVVRNDSIGTLVGGEIEPLPRIGDKILALDPLAVALAEDRRSAAVLHGATGSGSVVSWVSESDIVVLDQRQGLTEPGLDRFGYVWSYASSEPGEILVQRPGGEPDQLKLPALGERAPLAIRASPGGNRLALLFAGDRETSVVYTASIVRDAGSRPVALGSVAMLEMVVQGAPVDLDWVDEMRLVTLSRSNAVTKVTLGPLGQLSIDTGTVANAIAVSGGGTRSLIRVLDGEGRLFGPQGSGWQWQSDDVRVIVRSG